MMKCLRVEDALSYLDEVKERFAGQGAIYTDFLDVMREFKMQTIGTEVVIRRVRELFEGHPDLIVGFNNFIPQGYRVDAPPSRMNSILGCSRTTVAAPIIESVSPPKQQSTITEFGASTITLSPAFSHHDCVNRATVNPPSVCVTAPLTDSQSFRTNSNCGPLETSHFAPNAHTLFGSGFQENIPGSVFRGSFSASSSVAPHSVTGTNICQQQQQAQSFHHALHYVNKIKNRFQGIPDAYKRFLDILQWYQKEQRHSDAVRRKLAEKQVYQDVAKLFDGQEDLLQEFSQFLPESTNVTNAVTENFVGRRASGQMQSSPSIPSPEVHVPAPQIIDRVSEGISLALSCRQKIDSHTQLPSMDGKRLKRLAPVSAASSIYGSANATKKSRSAVRDVSITEINQLASGLDVSLLHKAASPNTYAEISCGPEGTIDPASFSEHKDVEKCDRERWFSTGNAFEQHPGSTLNASSDSTCPVPGALTDPGQRRLDLDFAKLRTCGTSYRALPANFPQAKCSGRLKCPIAREVLNDSFISFSSLTSEDSQFVSSKKNQYEEHMYRVEDERYEVDMVIELNRAAMQNLVVVKRRMDRMNREELSRFTLDESLSGTSAILMRKAIHRVYGDKAGDVIYGLKNCPSTVIPLVIQRMRQKDSEWREAIRTYQRSWEEQDSRNYLRSLDHQGASFKQRDAPLIRSKTMVSQIEAIARDDKSCCPLQDPIGTMISASLTQPCLTNRTDLRTPGTFGSALINVNEGYKEHGAPHLALVYPPPQIRNALLEDAASLIIHHVKRQSNTNKEDKRTMKFLMRTVVQDLFMADRFPMSDDEEDDDEDDFDHKDDLDELDESGAGDETSRTRSGRQTRLKRPRKYGTENSTSEEMDNHQQSPRLDSEAARSRISAPELSGDKFGSNAAPSSTLDNWRSPAHYDACSSIGFPCDISYPTEEHYSVLYGNDHWYAFLRLHHLLICRLHLLRSRGEELMEKAASENGCSPVQAAEVLRLKRCGEADPSEYYTAALSLVKDLLDGGEDVTRYEDRLRNMFGIYAYPWFTLDRLVINIVRQLHALASGDELSHRLTALHRSWAFGTTIDSTCNSPFPHRSTQSTAVPPFHASSVRGPLCSRVCRLRSEAAYRTQALAVVNSFSNNGNSIGSSTQSGTAISSSGQGNGCPSSSTNVPNCYAIVMLTEASALLIRLISPINIEGSLSDSMPHICNASHRDFNSGQPSLGKQSLTLDVPAKRWLDYLATHLVWTLGFIPRDVVSRVRPVFLYRTVRRCIRSLTRSAYHRRRQELVDTGDTQPEELLYQALTACDSSGTNLQDESASKLGLSETHTGDMDSSCESRTSDEPVSTVNFEHGVWEFMRHVFHSDLTRKELFRDTYSSDCMQSTDRLTSRVNPRTHKINWSVGSYGIFIRRKHRCNSVDLAPSVQKWRIFHSRWLQNHTDPAESQISAKRGSPVHPQKEVCRPTPAPGPEPVTGSHSTSTDHPRISIVSNSVDRDEINMQIATCLLSRTFCGADECSDGLHLLSSSSMGKDAADLGSC
ncbi:unnamed protein product [Dicrocoelium dendriticum]|nr:unnamed protein product [Dicrocoelium dendriticum]